ncbi:MAG: FHA domain-containing serine/threonine-protein kinase [Planctomycetota bacterium]
MESALERNTRAPARGCSEAPSPAMIQLQALSGPDIGRSLHYAVMEFELGRAATPDMQLRLPSDPQISRHHASVRVTDEGLEIRIRDGTASLFICGAERVQQELVPWGSEFRLGATVFRATRSCPNDASVRTLPQRTLDEFHVVEEVGSGLSSIVLEGIESQSGRRIALKRMRADARRSEDMTAQFAREVNLHARLRHPNIVRIECVGRSEGELFIGMQWVDGFDLEEHVTCGGPLAAATAVPLGLRLLDALAYAHECGVVHRDVKPKNVMIEDGRFEQPLLVDFGMARAFGAGAAWQSLTQTGEGRGTLAFASPEALQDAKRAGPPADVFGVGATLYFALTGRPWFDEQAFERDPATLLRGQVVPLRSRSPALPAELCAVVERALAPRPEARWMSAGEMSAALEAVELE